MKHCSDDYFVTLGQLMFTHPSTVNASLGSAIAALATNPKDPPPSSDDS
jgi:hypothetical protein